MKRYRQTLDEIVGSLSPIESDWRDATADAVISRLHAVQQKPHYDRSDLKALLLPDDPGGVGTLGDRFKVGRIAVRLFLGLSEDEFKSTFGKRMGKGGIGVTRFTADPDEYCSALEETGILELMASTTSRRVTWEDLLAERLRGGRGSAIKGQRRGRWLENFVERIVVSVFGEVGYEVRCRFSGAAGLSTEKCDCAIPSRSDPRVLIEAKGYGATGSKQTDVIGDIDRIVNEKRNDTTFLLVTDGVTWRARRSDLAKLVEKQNLGEIARIYTVAMRGELEQDLVLLKQEHGL